MENTMHLWEIKNFQSSSVKSLFVGRTANGQDCIACAWNSSELYVFAYEGIVDTFLWALETFKSVGQAMAYAKLRNDFEDRRYSLPYHETMEQRTHNQLYMFQLQYLHIFESTLEIHSNLCDDTPENAIKNLISRGDIEAENSRLVNVLRHREVCACPAPHPLMKVKGCFNIFFSYHLSRFLSRKNKKYFFIYKAWIGVVKLPPQKSPVK